MIDGGFLARKARAITPSDTALIEPRISGFYVGTAGNVRVILEGDDSFVTLTNAQAGQIYPLAAKMILSSGTTASNIVGLAP